MNIHINVKYWTNRKKKTKQNVSSSRIKKYAPQTNIVFYHMIHLKKKKKIQYSSRSVIWTNSNRACSLNGEVHISREYKISNSNDFYYIKFLFFIKLFNN